MTHNRQDRITLAHGNGGRLMRELIETIFSPAFGMNKPELQADASQMQLSGNTMLTTDSYTVEPLFFPGGDIGKLAVCGTVNDLVVSGSLPRFMSVNFLIEEGFALNDLHTIVNSIANEARRNDVKIITGDTKVLPKGAVQGIYVVTTGVGQQLRPGLGMHSLTAGDQLFVSGPIGDHATAVLLARGQYGLQGNLHSDCASLLTLCSTLMQRSELKFMRDPTRGGLASVCHEIIQATGLGVRLIEQQVPIRDAVQTFCDVLGFNPYYLACEGRVVFAMDASVDIHSVITLADGIQHIGRLEADHANLVLQTPIGGTRLIPELDHDPLPRIC